MPTPITITAGSVSLAAELDDTPLARTVAAKLPIEATPNEWGDEFYFGIPVRADLDETATKKVKVGDIGFWPPGNAMAIFFGPTPMSSGADPVPASAVCIIGRITGDATLLKQALGVRTIRIETA
ncbi:MAG: cyclophilin-like fold protein [Thermodesulfobacteriota bacterium]